MTRVVRYAALLLVAGGILVAAGASANVPDPSKCTLGSNIANPANRPYQGVEGWNDFGSNPGVRTPDECSDGRCAEYEVTIKDALNNAINNSAVVADFSGCPDIRVSCDQLTPETGQINLGAKRVQGNTNSDGKFMFRIQGGSNAVILAGPPATSAGTNAGTICADWFADGQFIGSTIVHAYDVDGAGTPAAVNGNDGSIVLQESAKVGLGASPRARDDYWGPNRFTNPPNNNVDGSDGSSALVMSAQQGLGSGSSNTSPFIPSCP